MSRKISMKGKGHYAIYKNENLCSKNKKNKLIRHLNKNPSDDVAHEALSKGNFQCRKAPFNNVWSKTNKRLAKYFKEVGLRGNSVLNIHPLEWAEQLYK